MGNIETAHVFLACLEHCANGKVGLALIYPLLTQPLLSSSRFILKDLLLFDGNSSKHTVLLHQEHRAA